MRGVTDLMVMPGLINLDFADIRTVMSEMGKAMMGTGEAEGEDRAIDAAEAAISNPLLDDVSMKGATRRADQHHRRPRHDAVRGRRGGQPHPRGSRSRRQHHLRLDLRRHACEGRMRVSVVATGIDAMAAQQPAPNYLSLDMNRPMQTGQPALSRPAAPPVGRVAMPAAAMAPPPAPMAAPSRRRAAAAAADDGAAARSRWPPSPRRRRSPAPVMAAAPQRRSPKRRSRRRS